VDEIEEVDAVVGQLASAVVKEPAVVEAVTVGIVSGLRRRAEIEIPVDARGGRAIGRGPDAGGEHVAIDAAAGGDDVAELAGADNLRGLPAVGRGATVNADLDDALGLAGDVDDLAALDDGERERFLDVNVFARAAGVDAHEGVPVVGGGDHDGVDVVAVEDAAVVFIGVGGRAGGFDGAIAIGRDEVADGGDVLIGELFGRPEEGGAAVADADEAEADAVGGALDLRIGGGGEGGGLGETAAGGRRHGGMIAPVSRVRERL